MNVKRILSVLLVSAFLLGMLPMAAVAQPFEFVLKGPRQATVQARTAAAVPTLAPGHHQDYLDRVTKLPDYALEYYRWLEDNACAEGVLADPTKATVVKGKDGSIEYYHLVTSVSGTEMFMFTSQAEMEDTVTQIVTEALGEAYTSFKASMSVIQDVFDREHPEVFWLSGRYDPSYLGSYSYSASGNICTVTYEADMVMWLQYDGFDIRSDQYLSPKTIKADIKTRDAAIQEILNGCPQGSDYDRVGYLNDTLTARNAYNSAVVKGNSAAADSNAWECISALVGQSGSKGPVCEGYARAFQVLCDKLNIPCVAVNGSAISKRGDQPEAHMWNYVQIDGGWYAVDVTWNDPYVPSKSEQKKSGNECRDWFLLGSDTSVASGLNFLQSHVVTNQLRSDGLAYTNGPVLERTAYDPNAVSGSSSIRGTVTSAGNGTVTVELWQSGTLKATQTLTGNQASYSFADVTPGTYELKISKTGSVTRSENVTVTGRPVTQDAKVCLWGDITGDGKVNVGDVSRLYAAVKQTAVITDPYMLACADVTGDGRVNVGDTARLYAYIRQ